MGKFEVTQNSLQERAHRGDLSAIAQLLQYIITTYAEVQVSRHGSTLEVCLINAHRGSLSDCALMVYSAIYALGLKEIHQLIVLEGVPQENLPQWQQTFTLAVAVPDSPPALSETSPEKARGCSPARDYVWGGDPVLAAAYGSETVPVRAPAFPQPISQFTTPQSGRFLPEVGKRGLTWSAVLVFSFFLGAAMAQWRHDQSQTLVEETAAEAISQSDRQPSGEVPMTSDGKLIDGSPDRPIIPAPAPLGPMGPALAQTPPALEAGPTVTIKAVGDMVMGTNYPRTRMPEDWQYFFDAIKFHLGDADLVFGNFESTLTEVPNSSKNTSRPMTFAFRSPPWYASVLRAAGFDVLSVANNHSMDFFEQGFNDTIANIESEGMIAVGRKGDIQYTEVNGVKIAFIGFSYLSVHNSVHDLATASALVQEAEQNADVVIISVHAGKEGTDAVFSRNQEEFFYSENRGNLVHFSRTVVDHGADLVLGHGPHVPRAVELYNNRLIAYSLGNFLGYRTLSTQGPLGLSLILQARMDGEGQFVNGRIIPAALDPNGVPYLDNHFGSVILVRNATRRDFPDTPLVIDDVGNILRQE